MVFPLSRSGRQFVLGWRRISIRLVLTWLPIGTVGWPWDYCRYAGCSQSQELFCSLQIPLRRLLDGYSRGQTMWARRSPSVLLNELPGSSWTLEDDMRTLMQRAATEGLR